MVDLESLIDEWPADYTGRLWTTVMRINDAGLIVANNGWTGQIVLLRPVAGDPGPDPDPEAGGDFLFRLNVLPGDADGDQEVTLADFVQIRACIGQTTVSPEFDARFDVDGNGGINLGDALQARSRIGQVLPAGEPQGPAEPVSSTEAIWLGA